MRVPRRMIRWRMLAASAALCVLATFLSAVPALAGPAPGLCTMNTSRGAVPAKFPIQACVDGSGVYLYNSTTLVLRVITEGSVGQPATTSTNYTLGVEAVRLRYGGEWVLMPGDKMRIPIGSASAGVNVELDTSAERYYALANTVATFIPDGKLLDSVNVFADFIATINADFVNYQNCLVGRNFLGRAGCFALFSASITNAVKDLGLGLAAHVVSAILGVLLAAKTFVEWLDVQVPQVESLINPPAILQAAVRGASPSPTPTPTPTSTAGSGGWAAAGGPVPAGSSSGMLQAVTCPSTATCVAVGTDSSAGRVRALILTGSGTSWTAEDTAMPANAESGDDINSMSVACATTTSCAAVGDYADTAGNGRAFLMTESGGSWTAAEAPVPADAAPEATTAPVDLNSVACETATACIAVGQYVDSSGLLQPLLLTRSGTSWTATRAALPANSQGGTLSSVACESATACIAVGTYTSASGANNGLLLSGSGGSWTTTTAPLPANANSDYQGVTLDSVTCPSTTSCAASGNYTTSSGSDDMLLLTASGNSWTAAGAPLPADMAATGTMPTAIACSSPASCTAVGYYTDTAGVYKGMAATGSGTNWTSGEFAMPDARTGTGAAVFQLSVACPSAAGCVTVSWYEDASNVDQALVATGSGSSWTSSAAPLPANAEVTQSPGLPAVACTSATSCVAVGWYGVDTSSGAGLAPLLLTGPA